ncbi:MAG TPA: hypothetical protein VN426_14530 [Syntrophomonadaceae bacterium]|nr:hypothetical protein [Syntrophomonadaceae bacterium]
MGKSFIELVIFIAGVGKIFLIFVKLLPQKLLFLHINKIKMAPKGREDAAIISVKYIGADVMVACLADLCEKWRLRGNGK